MRLPNGARYESLGGAGAAAAEGSEALFWNPAGLGRSNETSPSELSLSYSNLLQGAYEGAAAYSRPDVGPGNLGLGLVYFSQSSLTSYDATGTPTGSFTPSDMAFSGGYAGALWGVRLGGVFKVIRQTLAEASGTSAAIDAGVQADHVADIGDGPLDVGGAISNLGPPLKLGATSSPLPFSARGGLAWRASPNGNVLLDVVLPVDDAPYAALGTELYLRDKAYTAYLRLGFNQSATRHVDGLAGLTGGAGIDLKRFRLDYAWVPYGDLGMTNRITLSFRFDSGAGSGPEKPRKTGARSDDERLLQAIWALHAAGTTLSPGDLSEAGRRAELSDRAADSAVKRLVQQNRMALLRDGYAITADIAENPSDPRLSVAAAAARRGVSKLHRASPTQHLEALALFESAQRAYLAAPALSDQAAAENRQVAALRITAFVEALRDIVAGYEAKVEREPQNETTARLQEIARVLNGYVGEAAHGARPLKAPPTSAQRLLVVLADEYHPAGLERAGDAASGLESVRRMLAQLK